ncbi:RNA polymerase sigma factor [Neobacillus mesonae]|nr:RNA polymerase sigma factor [Neobacillus mesonae]
MTERELFDSYHKDVYRTCYYMLHHAQDAEDACHDIFITVFRQNWSNIEHFKAWIMRITMNHCLNVLRKNKTKREKQQLVQIQHDQSAGLVKSPDTIVIERATAEEYAVLLSQLPDKLRAVVTLRYSSDLSTAEIAEALGIPAGTVKSRLHKALKLMRAKMEKEGIYRLEGERPIGIY